MTTDQNDDKDDARAPLPEHVERALAEARKRTNEPRSWRTALSGGSKDGRVLALVPVSAFLLMMLLMMPRSAAPEDIPLPRIDGIALRAVHADDARRAEKARSERLPGEVLAVGTALRAFNKAQVHGTTSEEAASARGGLDEALSGLAALEQGQVFDALKTLRALQLEAFLAEVTRYEKSGKVSPELEEVGGPFVDRMSAAGWVEEGRVLLDDAQRRAAFKLVWTAMIGGEHHPTLALALDEQRALYTLYLERPHAPEGQRAAFEAMRSSATTEVECQNAVRKERFALEQWRADKIKKLAEIDPTYPAGYALGVAYYRAGRYDLSMEAFRSWLVQHPDGPLTLRARNHMKAALDAYGPS